jgi:RNA polymerase sigma-70 factor (ECF subfamily)
VPVVRDVLRGRGVDAATLDEAVQRVRERLLVARGDEPPRIADYAGRGPLRRWVRAVAVHTWLNQIRGHRREALVGDQRVLEALSGPEPGSDLAYLKRRYRAELAAALQESLAELGDRERLLLRYRYVDGLSAERVATLFHTHRSSVYRWLEEVRAALAARIMAALAARLGGGESDAESIRRLVLSQLELTLSRVLADR